jgi:hypothetical protein
MKLTYIVSFCLLVLSCSPDQKQDDKIELLRLHELQREAHFSKKAGAMVDLFADNLLSVSGGKIYPLASREADQKRFQNYFDAVKFVKWDDVTPPKIRFSDDHSLAYMTIDKLVVLETSDSTGKAIEETTHFAWITIFRKQESGEWKIECVASTNEPEVVKPI